MTLADSLNFFPWRRLQRRRVGWQRLTLFLLGYLLLGAALWAWQESVGQAARATGQQLQQLERQLQITRQATAREADTQLTGQVLHQRWRRGLAARAVAQDWLALMVLVQQQLKMGTQLDVLQLQSDRAELTLLQADEGTSRPPLEPPAGWRLAADQRTSGQRRHITLERQ